MAAVRIAFALAAAATVLASCGSPDEPEDPLVLDWKRGTYEGVQLGDDDTALRRVLGRPVKQGAQQPFEPIDEDFYEIGGLTNFGSPMLPGRDADSRMFRYRHRVFMTTSGRLTAWGTTDTRAQTPEGVGVGDDQAVVKRRYPTADCFTQNEGTEYATYPICRVKVCEGRLLGFGGDPIKSVWLAAETKTGLRHCAA